MLLQILGGLHGRQDRQINKPVAVALVRAKLTPPTQFNSLAGLDWTGGLVPRLARQAEKELGFPRDLV